MIHSANISGKKPREKSKKCGKDMEMGKVEPNIPLENGRRNIAQSMEPSLVSGSTDHHGMDLEEAQVAYSNYILLLYSWTD